MISIEELFTANYRGALTGFIHRSHPAGFKYMPIPGSMFLAGFNVHIPVVKGRILAN